MELIDLYDENRFPLSKTIERGKPIGDGEYKLSVHIWVTNSLGEVYIQKRAGERKLFPNKWENPGGGVVSGDDSLKTLKKEFEEELGIPFGGNFELIKTIRRKKDFVDIYHVSQNFNLEELNLQKEEVSEAKWVTIKKINEMIEKGEFCSTIVDSFIPFVEYYNKRIKK